MARSKNRGAAEVNAGSMADIAFLLLIFFLVSTQMASDKGILMQLPPKPDPNLPPPEVKANERNIFKIQVNSQDQLLVEDEPLADVTALKEMVQDFVLNPNNDENLSENPEEAIVSLKTDRGSSYEIFINVLDQLHGAYNEIYAKRAGITLDQWNNLDKEDPKQAALYEKGRAGIPKQISIAQPTKAGGQ
jgi:biopolymer transport protein ExbD